MHEEFSSDDDTIEAGSGRSFGLAFAAFLTLVALWPLWHGNAMRVWAFVPAAALGGLGLFLPSVLIVPDRLWRSLGKLLGRITGPVVLGMLFYGVVTPAALCFRLAGKRLLDLRFDAAAQSYWRPRLPPGPEPDDMTNPF